MTHEALPVPLEATDTEYIDLIDQEESAMAASEFQRTLMSYLSRQGMSVTNLAEHTGYSHLLRERRFDTLLGIWNREAKLALDQRLTQSHENPL